MFSLSPMSSRTRVFGAVFLLSHISSILLGIPVVPNVRAQSFQPISTAAPSTAFQDGQAMYILGGYRNYTPSTQAFMVDLSVSWTASAPALKQLPDGPAGSFLPSTLSADGQSWFILVNSAGIRYNIKSGQWSSVDTDNSLNTAGELSAVTDTETGLVYVLKGYNNGQAMLRADLVNNKFDSVAMPQSVNANITYHAAWSSSLRSIVFFGGEYDSAITYTPSQSSESTGGWNTLTTTGQIPDARPYPCLVPAYNGSKMVLFGGLYGGLSSRGDISVLDISTLTWTSGPDDASDARAQSACAVSNDYFISWGGMRMGSAYNGNIILYNLKTGQWTPEYVAAASAQTSQGTMQASVSHAGAVAGLVLAGLVVLLVIGSVVVLYRRRARSVAESRKEMDEKTEYPFSAGISNGPVDSRVA